MLLSSENTSQIHPEIMFHPIYVPAPTTQSRWHVNWTWEKATRKKVTMTQNSYCTWLPVSGCEGEGLLLGTHVRLFAGRTKGHQGVLEVHPCQHHCWVPWFLTHSNLMIVERQEKSRVKGSWKPQFTQRDWVRARPQTVLSGIWCRSWKSLQTETWHTPSVSSDFAAFLRNILFLSQNYSLSFFFHKSQALFTLQEEINTHYFFIIEEKTLRLHYLTWNS